MPTHKTVILNKGYRKNAIGGLEGHNERLRSAFSNPGIALSRSSLNLQFKKPEGSYFETLRSMEAKGLLTLAGLRRDSYMLDEFVLDVNSLYFEERGGYPYAARFYEDAYAFAAREAGGEKWIVSAVMHADELHRNLSLDLGHSVFHYHLHVVYAPVVEASVHYPKNYPDLSLAGKTEIANKISHSRKWPIAYEIRPDGSKERISSYSALQDRYYEAMQDAGHKGLSPVEHGSSLEKLSTLEFKTLKEREVLAGLEGRVLDAQRQLDISRDALSSVHHAASSLENVEKKAHRTLAGKIALRPGEWQKAKALILEGQKAQLEKAALSQKIAEAEKARDSYAERFEALGKKHEALQEKTSDFRKALLTDRNATEKAVSNILEKARVREKEIGRDRDW
jgi:hypothetical protein